MRILLVVVLGLLWLPLVTWGDSLLDRGIAALQAQNYGEAVAIFSQTIGKFPGASYGNRCLAYLQLGEYEKAELDCTEGLAFLPHNGSLWLDRGLSFYYQGKYDRALSDFNRGIELDPSNYRIFYDRALVYSALQQSDRALADYSQALGLVPPEQQETRAEILTDRGIELMMTGELATALTDFDLGIKLDGTNSRIWFHRGCAHHRLAQLEEALADFDRTLLIDPHNPEAYKGRGIVQKQRGALTQALADLDRAQSYFLAQGEVEAYQQIVALKQRWLVKRYA